MTVPSRTLLPLALSSIAGPIRISAVINALLQNEVESAIAGRRSSRSDPERREPSSRARASTS
jgi:hypothetical protein